MAERKTISLPKSVYDDLTDEQLPEESFADTIRRLLTQDPQEPTVDGLSNEDLLAQLPARVADEIEGRFR